MPKVVGAGSDSNLSRVVPARKLEVYFDSRDGSGSVDPHATWTFKSGVYVDSAAQVTFWQSSVSEALTW